MTNGTVSLATLDADTVDAVLGAADLEADRPLASVEIRTMGPATRPALRSRMQWEAAPPRTCSTSTAHPSPHSPIPTGWMPSVAYWAQWSRGAHR